MNVHLHRLVLDGVYRCSADGALTFVEMGAPTEHELRALLQKIIARLMKMLTRRGVLIEEMGQAYLAVPDDVGEDARALRLAALVHTWGWIRSRRPGDERARRGTTAAT